MDSTQEDCPIPQNQHLSGVVTVFVSNLPPRLHWQGLWAAFAHHGDVVDAFIPAKRSQDENRFGFVRLANMNDAQRVISRLDDFLLFGNRISVSIAKYKTRSQFWKKVQIDKNVEVPGLVLNKASSSDCLQIQVEGIVDRVIREKLKACVIGTTKKIYKPAQLLGILEEKGWDEFDVQYVAGNQFILMFDREEIAASCLEWGWEWLSEFFSDLRRWHKEFTPENRVTWVEVLGVPLHAWNNFTFNNILNRWGELLFIEDEHLVGKDFSSKRVKILTNHMELIQDSMSLNCDGDFFKVWVRELNSSVSFAQDLTNSKDGFLESGYNSEEIYSKSESSFVENSSTHLQQNSGDVVFAPTGEVETVVVVEVLRCEKAGALVPDDLCPKVELLNGVDAQCLGLFDSTQAPLKQPLHCVEPHNLNNIDILGSIEIAARTELSSHAVEGGGSLIAGAEDFLTEVEMAPNNGKGLSWVESVDLLNNPSSFKDEVVNRNRLVKSEEESFLSELVKFRGKKEYVSLFDLHDEVLSIKEKRKRDRAIKKSKKLGKENSSFDSSRRSPSESDIIQNQRIIKSTKKAMELGNKVGIQFIGDEEETLEDFVKAELQHM
ncbi:hypothetical protein V6N13_026123 [Hibiscus sabdariffa]